MVEIKLRKYEAVIVIRPTLDDEAIDRAVNTIEEFIKSQGGIIIAIDKKGRRRLSYEVKKMKDGFFVVLRFEAKPEFVSPFKRMLSLNEDIIRSIMVSLGEEALATSI